MPQKGQQPTPRALAAMNKFPPLPPWVDPIRLGKETYARNSMGLHVPAKALTMLEQMTAPDWRENVERKR
jgi:hypothetical protein